MRRLLVLAAIACVSPTAPCIPELGPGCRYVAVTVHDGATVIQVRTAVYDPCLPKEESDRRFPGWQVVPDTIKPCPPARGGLQP